MIIIFVLFLSILPLAPVHLTCTVGAKMGRSPSSLQRRVPCRPGALLMRQRVASNRSLHRVKRSVWRKPRRSKPQLSCGQQRRAAAATGSLCMLSKALPLLRSIPPQCPYSCDGCFLATMADGLAVLLYVGEKQGLVMYLQMSVWWTRWTLR